MICGICAAGILYVVHDVVCAMQLRSSDEFSKFVHKNLVVFQFFIVIQTMVPLPRDGSPTAANPGGFEDLPGKGRAI